MSAIMIVFGGAGVREMCGAGKCPNTAPPRPGLQIGPAVLRFVRERTHVPLCQSLLGRPVHLRCSPNGTAHTHSRHHSGPRSEQLLLLLLLIAASPSLFLICESVTLWSPTPPDMRFIRSCGGGVSAGRVWRVGILPRRLDPHASLATAPSNLAGDITM